MSSARFFKAVTVFLLTGLATMALPAAVFAATGAPKIINYQGRLLDASGNLLGGTAGQNYCFRFSLYDAANSGTRLWPNSAPATTTVQVKNGIFDYGIGSGDGGGDANVTYNFNDTDTVYLNVEVASTASGLCTESSLAWETLSPRKRVFSSGYAINSSTVGGFTPSQQASGNQIPVLTSGNLTLTGTNPQINATTTNALVLQGASGVTGDIQFFNSANKITSSGALIVATLSATSASTTELSVAGGLYTPLSAGSLPFIGANGLLSESSTALVWDNANHFLGIGTTSPYAALSVAGQVVASFFSSTSTTATSTVANTLGIGGTTTPMGGPGLIVAGAAANQVRSIAITDGGLCVDIDGGCVPTPGYVDAVNGTRTQSSDVAEAYPSLDSALTPGTVVMVDAAHPGWVSRANGTQTLLGIVSTKPGVFLGDQTGTDATTTVQSYPIALAGRIPTRVNLDGGPIAVGDHVTLSLNTPGVGMKATTSSQAIGIALDSFDGSGSSTSTVASYTREGTISVFVNLGWQRISSAISDGTITAPSWLIDSATGQVRTAVAAGLNMQDEDIRNVRAISAASGKWSIGEDGSLIADSIEAVRAKFDSGVAIKDHTTGAYDCVIVDNGIVKTEPGECPENPSTTQASLPASPAVEVAASSTPDAPSLPVSTVSTTTPSSALTAPAADPSLPSAASSSLSAMPPAATSTPN